MHILWRAIGCEWKIKNVMRHVVISPEIFFSFYLQKVISDIFRIPVGCALNFNKVNLLGHAGNLVLVAPSALTMIIMSASVN